MNDVREFHEHMGITPKHEWPDEPLTDLSHVGSELVVRSKGLLEAYNTTNDVRYLRAHLILEEAGELMIALAHCDVVETLDALADMCYVVLGTACVYDLPLPEAFEEVHRSNMTKKPSDQRCSDKTGYVPPDLEKLL